MFASHVGWIFSLGRDSLFLPKSSPGVLSHEPPLDRHQGKCLLSIAQILAWVEKLAASKSTQQEPDSAQIKWRQKAADAVVLHALHELLVCTSAILHRQYECTITLDEPAQHIGVHEVKCISVVIRIPVRISVSTLLAYSLQTSDHFCALTTVTCYNYRRSKQGISFYIDDFLHMARA